VGTTSAQQHSGFLGGAYSKLADAQSPSGQNVMRWIAPAVTAGKYELLLLENTVLYPAPRSTPQVSVSTLNEISAYLDEALRRELSGVVNIVAEPGPKTLRFRPAITAAVAKDLGLKPYQYLPVAFIVTGGRTSKGASLAVEYEIQDTDTGEVVGAGMREGTGLELKGATDKLTLAHFKPVVDAWAKDMRAFVEAAQLQK
jgi:hypothetical protein